MRTSIYEKNNKSKLTAMNLQDSKSKYSKDAQIAKDKVENSKSQFKNKTRNNFSNNYGPNEKNFSNKKADSKELEIEDNINLGSKDLQIKKAKNLREETYKSAKESASQQPEKYVVQENVFHSNDNTQKTKNHGNKENDKLADINPQDIKHKYNNNVFSKKNSNSIIETAEKQIIADVSMSTKQDNQQRNVSKYRNEKYDDIGDENTKINDNADSLITNTNRDTVESRKIVRIGQKQKNKSLSNNFNNDNYNFEQNQDFEDIIPSSSNLQKMNIIKNDKSDQKANKTKKKKQKEQISNSTQEGFFKPKNKDAYKSFNKNFSASNEDYNKDFHYYKGLNEFEKELDYVDENSSGLSFNDKVNEKKTYNPNFANKESEGNYFEKLEKKKNIINQKLANNNEILESQEGLTSHGNKPSKARINKENFDDFKNNNYNKSYNADLDSNYKIPDNFGNFNMKNFESKNQLHYEMKEENKKSKKIPKNKTTQSNNFYGNYEDEDNNRKLNDNNIYHNNNHNNEYFENFEQGQDNEYNMEFEAFDDNLQEKNE